MNTGAVAPFIAQTYRYSLSNIAGPYFTLGALNSGGDQEIDTGVSGKTIFVQAAWCATIALLTPLSAWSNPIVIDMP